MEIGDQDMLPVPIREFVQGMQIPVDLYVRISANKYILVAKTGTMTDVDHLSNYENKSLQELWIRREDYRKYVDQSVLIACEIVKEPRLQISQRASILFKAASNVLNEIQSIGLSVESYNHARAISENSMEIVAKSPSLTSALELLQQSSSQIYNHAVAVSVISVMLAKANGWQKPLTLEKIALGGLIHDIGMREIPPDLHTKPRIQMTFSEVSTYESHPYRGVQLLQTIGNIVPEDVLAIVYEHHEIGIGQGYPRQLKDMRINPLARIVGLANQFVELVLPKTDGTAPRTPREAINYIEMTMGQPFNKEAFRALKSLVQKSGGTVPGTGSGGTAA